MSLYDWDKTVTVTDPSKNIDIVPSTIAGDIWSTASSYGNSTLSANSLMNETLEGLVEQIELLKLDSKLMKLKILCMEGKFSQEEVANIRKMLMSKDKASRTLAETIIENT